MTGTTIWEMKSTVVIFFFLCFPAALAAAALVSKDVIIYGSTPAAISAAIQVKRMGKSVALVYPQPHIGGLTANGLSWTDTKNGKAIGGIAREFYEKIYDHYNTDDVKVWKFDQSRSEYSSERPYSQQGKNIDTSTGEQWSFEPSVAQAIFDKMLAAENVGTHHGEYLDRKSGVTKSGTKITKICMLSGNCYIGKQFIDAGYEGDLMDTAGINSTTGRDDRSETKESTAGMFISQNNDHYAGVDPYVIKGKKDSGLLPGIETTVPTSFPMDGPKDTLRIQNFNFRLTLTTYPANMVPVTQPTNYDESKYELLLRIREAGKKIGFTNTTTLPNHKLDGNSIAGMSLDYIGASYSVADKVNFATATYEQRLAMHKAHKEYQQGLLYTLSHSPRIDAKSRAYFAKWGLCKDEFTDNDGWPRQIYVREARRMQGPFIMHMENVNRGAKSYSGKSAIVGMGSYSIDSHTARRVVQNGQIYDEGSFYIRNPTPYPIPYEALYPHPTQATNFLNPVTLSMTHVALGSIRMEPTYMILGQSVGIAAVHAIDENVAVQKIDQIKLKQAIKDAKQVTSI